ncbi:hypothetical protein L209DRAFT_751416 [Thermothelomyces heterothallicus CBS 203.75]
MVEPFFFLFSCIPFFVHSIVFCLIRSAIPPPRLFLSQDARALASLGEALGRVLDKSKFSNVV